MYLTFLLCLMLLRLAQGGQTTSARLFKEFWLWLFNWIKRDTVLCGLLMVLVAIAES